VVCWIQIEPRTNDRIKERKAPASPESATTIGSSGFPYASESPSERHPSVILRSAVRYELSTEVHPLLRFGFVSCSPILDSAWRSPSRVVHVTDHIDPVKRSLNMAAIRSLGTKPEVAVRSLVKKLGYRFGTNIAKLPGKPDLVFARRRKVIFVHGCFWHRHRGCARATMPSTRTEFWESKLSSNVKRDRRIQRELKTLGWQVLIAWQCELKKPESLMERLNEFLER